MLGQRLTIFLIVFAVEFIMFVNYFSNKSLTAISSPFKQTGWIFQPS